MFLLLNSFFFDMISLFMLKTLKMPSRYLKELFCYFSERHILELMGCRHPVMEATPDSPQFIPNDVVLGEEQGG